MGLPRVSGKRRWSVEEEEVDMSLPPAKAVCTSPPYGLCAEDVLPNAPCPRRVPEPSSHSAMGDSQTIVDYGVTDITETRPHDMEEADRLDDDLVDDDFSDDEEDKDSGFIDGNSIDNSDDDDESAGDAKLDTSFNSSESSPTSKDDTPPLPEANLQISLAKILPSTSSSLQATLSSIPAATSSSQMTYSVTHPSASVEHSLPSASVSVLSSTSSSHFTSQRSVETNEVPISITTATASTVPTNATTTVTKSYQVAVASTTYNIHSYQSSSPAVPFVPSSYPSELYENRPCTPSWSCTFYDGSQPTSTNKYMEISPSRGGPAPQSIQCDENGKSYLELGGAAPYTTTYNNECRNFTSSQPSYNNSYSQSFAGSTPPSHYGTNNGYYTNNNRPAPPGTPPPFVYHRPESYNGYDAESSTYTYVNGSYIPHNPSRAGNIHTHRVQIQRCSSPICDLTRTSPRPACYHQQRLSMLNMSMFKLNRFSRFPEPSLLRSVLICNTLRHIEREMESEGLNMAAILAHSHSYGAHGNGSTTGPPQGTPCMDTMPSMPLVNSSEGPLPSLHSPLIASPLQTSPHPSAMSPPPPSTSPFTPEAHPSIYSPYPLPHETRDTSIPFEPPSRDGYPLRPIPSQPSLGDRSLQPLNAPESMNEDQEDGTTGIVPSSRIQGEERIGGINWCSVLSLSSQTDLDTMNNNECHDWAQERDATSTLSSTTTLTTLTTRVTGTTQHECTGSSTSTNCNSIISSPRPVQEVNEENSSSSSGWRLPSLSADDVLKSFPEHPRREEDLDSIINVLVGS